MDPKNLRKLSLYSQDKDLATFSQSVEKTDILKKFIKKSKKKDNSLMQKLPLYHKDNGVAKFQQSVEENELMEKLLDVISEIPTELPQKGDDGITPIFGVDFLTPDEMQAIKDDLVPVFGLDYFTDEQIQSIVQKVTPLKGEDYFTAEEIESIKNEIRPVAGKDFIVPEVKDGYTPQYGVDYFTDSDIEKVVSILKKYTPKIKEIDTLKIEASVSSKVETSILNKVELLLENKEKDIHIDDTIQELNKKSSVVDWKVLKNVPYDVFNKKGEGSIRRGGVGTLQEVTNNGSTTNKVITVPGIQFNTTATPLTNAEGLLQWNATDGTLDLGMDGGDIRQQIGQELFIKVRNASGSPLANGTPVYFNGRQGNRPKIYPAKGDAEATSMVEGVTTQDIANNSDGFITTFGYVRQIKTDYTGWAEGDRLYVSTTTAGGLVDVEPSAPHHSDCIGEVAVVGGAGVGAIFVRIDRHKTLQELSDVNGTALTTDGQIPTWHNTEGYFDFDKNVNDYLKLDQSGTAQQVSGGTPFFLGGIRFGDGIHFGNGYDFNFTNDGYSSIAGTINETTSDFAWFAKFQAQKLLVDGQYTSLTVNPVSVASATVLGPISAPPLINSFSPNYETGTFVDQFTVTVYPIRISPDGAWVQDDYSASVSQYTFYNGGSPYGFSVGWDDVGADFYYVKVYDDTFSNEYYVEVAGSEFTLTISDVSQLNPGSATRQSTPYYLSSGLQYIDYTYYVYALATDGVNIVYTVSGPLYANDSTGNYVDVKIAWDTVVGATSYIVYNSNNNEYVDVGTNLSVLAYGATWVGGNGPVGVPSPLNVFENLIEATNTLGSSFVVDGNANLASTGKTYIADGTTAAPAYAFASQLDMGIYRKTTNSMAFAFSGYDRVIIDNTSLSLNNSLLFRSSGIGSAAAPAYSWVTDSNNGMYLASADTLAFSTAGTKRLEITSTGNALLGANTPLATTTPINFSFGGTYGSNAAGSTGNLKWDMYNSGSGNRYGIGMSAGLMEYQSGTSGGHAFFVNAGTRAFDIISSGNVGIGTSTPDTALSFTAGFGKKINFYNGIAMGIAVNSGELAFHLGATTGRSFVFYGGDNQTSEVMRILGTGKVGIGTTAPTNSLTIRSAVGANIGASNCNITLEDSTSQVAGAGGGFILYGPYNGTTNTLAAAMKAEKANSTSNNWDFNLGFYARTNGSSVLTEFMTLLGANGNLGIGTTTPAVKMHLKDSAVALRLDRTGLAHSYTAVGFVPEITADTMLNGSRYSTGGMVFNGFAGGATEPALTFLGYSYASSTAPSVLFGAFKPNGTGRQAVAGTEIAFMFQAGLDTTFNSSLATILGNGNVGFGTTTPDTKLQVVGGVKIGEDTTNYAEFGTNGDLTLYGTAKYERHIQIAAQVAGNVANQPASVEVGTAGGYQFASSGTQEELHIQWEVPDDWDGTAVKIEIDWLPNSGAMTNPDAVKWTFEYYSVAQGESIITGTMGTKSITYNTTTAQNVIVHSLVTLDDANQPLAVQDHVFIRCFRDTAVASDFAGTVVATAFEIIYNSKGFPASN